MASIQKKKMVPFQMVDLGIRMCLLEIHTQPNVKDQWRTSESDLTANLRTNIDALGVAYLSQWYAIYPLTYVTAASTADVRGLNSRVNIII